VKNQVMKRSLRDATREFSEPMRKCLLRLACVAVASLCVCLHAQACEVRAAARPALKRLQSVMATGRFIAYQPTAMKIINGRATQASRDSIQQDLAVLRPRFDGLITYGSYSGAEYVADVAATLGYRAVIMGVWDINNKQEFANVIAAAKRQPQLVVAVSLGNERLYAKQETATQLAAAINQLRQQTPQLALTTTEPFHVLLETDAAPIMQASDFMLVNVHPIFQEWFRNAPDANAAEFVVNVVAKLEVSACGPVLVKETGVPTAPAASGYTEQRQASFYQALQQRFKPSGHAAFTYFSAFDAPWRAYDESPVAGSHPEEAHFGLYDEQRRAKAGVKKIPLLK
jgi:exo-beta-1,3-glucanase (GH17 family)